MVGTSHRLVRSSSRCHCGHTTLSPGITSVCAPNELPTVQYHTGYSSDLFRRAQAVLLQNWFSDSEPLDWLSANEPAVLRR